MLLWDFWESFDPQVEVESYVGALTTAVMEPFQRAASHTVTHQLCRQPQTLCVGGEALARLQDNRKQAGREGVVASRLVYSLKALHCYLLLPCWVKLFQDPYFHFRKLFWPRSMLNSHFLELKKISPIILEVPKEMGSGMRLHQYLLAGAHL